MAQATLPAPNEGHHDDHGHDTVTGVTNTKLAMWVFLSSECLFFGAFIATYLLYRGRSVKGPTPRDVYNIPFTSVTSFILLMSSLTMVLALAAI
ncbi:MAG: cytochrome oxidase subunit III, partial [Acidimicrobiia bacterium]|nr:cytochrome oxidase subunit III [Acidimicrobiia bacterium]